MTRKSIRNAAVPVPLQQIVAQTTIHHDSLNVRIVRRELHKLADRIIQPNGDTTALRRILSNDTVEELWEVPG